MNFRNRRALATAGGVTIIAALVLPGLAGIVWTALRWQFGYDGEAFFHAARVGQSAGWGHIYDASQQLDLAAGRWFVSPPLVAFMAWPFAAAGPAAGALWLLVSVAAVIATLCLLRPGWSLAVVCVPLVWSLWLGQVAAFALLGLALALRWKQRPIWAGVALAVAFQIKPNLMLLLPLVLLGARQWRLLMAFAATSAAFAAAYLLILGPHFPGAYLHLLSSVSPNLPALAVLAIAAAAVLVGRRGREPIGQGVMLTLLSAAYIHPQDLALVAIPLASGPRTWTRAILGAAWAATCWALDPLDAALPTLLVAGAVEAVAMALFLSGLGDVGRSAAARRERDFEGAGISRPAR